MPWFNLIFGIIVTLGFDSLIYNKPYDFKIYSIQTAIIVSCIIIGIIIIVFVRRKLKDKMQIKIV